MSTIMAVWGLIQNFYDVVLASWWSHLITLVAGWHLLPQPGYAARLWMRIKHVFDKNSPLPGDK